MAQTPASEQSIDAIRQDLEDTFLTPQTSLPATWMNKFQEHWDDQLNYTGFAHEQLFKPITELQVVRHGYDGDIVGYHEYLPNNADLTANNSTSMTRAFGNNKDFVRGSAAQFPFAPGGLDVKVEDNDALTIDHDNDDEDMAVKLDLGFLDDVHLHSVAAPGLTRGIRFAEDDQQDQPAALPLQGPPASTVFNIEDMLKPSGMSTFDFLDTKVVDQKEKDDAAPDANATADEPQDVDALLPTQLPTETVAPKKLKSVKDLHKRRDWAHEINVNEPFDNFYEVVPEMAQQYPFELDTFQKHAIYHLEMGDSVFVAAHTSAGKTVVADYAIALASKHMTKAIYTSPIKALSNQKFRDFRQSFGEDVGILTGDVQIRPEASCLVMTTEILRSMLYRGADLIRDVEFVIFDEVHYVNDLERGVVWEEVIIMLPAHVNIILLSATVPNTKEFADWVGRTKKKDIYVISTLKRPVPLEHHLYPGKELFKIVAANEPKLNGVEYKKACDALMKRKDLTEKEAARGGKAGARGGARGGAASRGQVKQIGRSFQQKLQTDRNLFVHLIGLLNKKELLPVVIFTFSKRRCEEYASSLSKTDLCSSLEKSEIHVFIERSLVRLRGSDKELPQILRMRDLLSRGIAVHHGGLLPIIKEIVEILFARGLVKVLFATETFAMGVNMPARSVVFSGIRKHDGRSFRDLLPGEYTQMSGRAGRRGLDSTGMVIIACSGDEAPPAAMLSTMLLGKPTKLESQFRLTYNMILNLLRVEALKVEEMIKRSFSENSNQRLLPDTQRLVDENELKKSALQQVDCAICNADLSSFYDLNKELLHMSRIMMQQFIVASPISNRAFSPGRVLIINNNVHRNAPAVILRPVPAGTNAVSTQKSFYALVLASKDPSSTPFDKGEEELPLPITSITVYPPDASKTEIITITTNDIMLVTKTLLKADVEHLLSEQNAMEMTRAKQELEAFIQNFQKGDIQEFDWQKIKDIEFQEMLRSKTSIYKRLRSEFQCTKCPDLDDHYALMHAHKHLSGQIEMLKLTISDQNLELLPDYHQRVQVLQALNYIDEQGTVQLKGRVACEINSADELLLTELVLDNVFADFEPAEVVALLSAFVFQERNTSEPRLTPKLTKGKEIILTYARKIAEIQADSGLPISVEDYVNGFKFGLVEVVYEWARGLPFKYITDLTDVLEGSIVRCISRLDETCREVMGAARMIGDTSLYKKMAQAEEDIKRDIVFAASLYF
ncbi:antiviral helicase [Hesseltinella vesiculosa]|uniref:Antiviral helicase n=1 Tax=Hesseltinella vesiculosa TaxID=101127 RepID=A0A1X2GIF2_9FUNG|nr:antiviral helicase [Hesseltinella vesiculosa]